LIEANHLTKYYGSKRALDDVNFKIGSGEIVGLLGLNGAGKSTTMNILTGCISATAGSVKINGLDMLTDGKKAKKEIGYLPELFSFYPEMRVDEYLSFVCDLKGFQGSRKERNTHIAEICEKVGIADIRQRMIRNLSKGYKQRVGFAQALINHPKVLILDEPTIGLDPSQILEIRSLVKEIGQTNTIVISSHILSEIQSICNRILVIHQGVLAADDSPENLLKNAGGRNCQILRIAGSPDAVMKTLNRVKNVLSVKQLTEKEPEVFEYLIEGEPGTDLRRSIFFALADAGLPLLETSQSIPKLEDVFLHLVEARMPAEDESRKN
jgi:ABC-2 type transport system ATP-binding protein